MKVVEERVLGTHHERFSTATVSRVVADAGNVANETRTKVLIAIAKLQYCPNVHAAELRRANSGMLGIRLSAPG
jgi:LacI family transcriptional regulator